MKHYHVYDTTGEVMCVDAHHWILSAGEGAVIFYVSELEEEQVAVFNWSNVVCVREEEDDDDDDEQGILLPDWVPDVVLS
jgi:hypothetical protein